MLLLIYEGDCNPPGKSIKLPRHQIKEQEMRRVVEGKFILEKKKRKENRDEKDKTGKKIIRRSDWDGRGKQNTQENLILLIQQKREHH